MARHDPEFEVTWYSDGSLREGSLTDGFRIVRLNGYKADLIYRAAAVILRDRGPRTVEPIDDDRHRNRGDAAPRIR